MQVRHSAPRRIAARLLALLPVAACPALGQQYIEGVNDTLPVDPCCFAADGKEIAYRWTPQHTFDLTEIRWHTTPIDFGTTRVRVDDGGPPGEILREVTYRSRDTGWGGAAFDEPLRVIAGNTYFVTMHSDNIYLSYLAAGGQVLTYYTADNGLENWTGPFNFQGGRRMIQFFGFPGGDCDRIKRFNAKCSAGTLKAKVKSSLPEGTVLTVDYTGGQEQMTINNRGKGKLKVRNLSTRGRTVYIVECPEFSTFVDCQ